MGAVGIIAHRGASGDEYENSAAAFRRAVSLGADGVELDIHSTADGALVVHHDPELPGLGPIHGLSAREAFAATLPNGEHPPSLAQALELLRGLDVWVELKSLPAEHDQLLLAALDQGPTPKRYAVHSFDHRIVQRLGQRRPGLARGVLLASYLLAIEPVLQSAGATTLWMDAQLIDLALVQEVHHGGRRLIAWTVNRDTDARRLAALGVDGLCGNYPDRLRQAVA